MRETPDSVEDVIVEADGQWHTSDNKYGSGEWKASNPVVSKPSSPKRPPPPPANSYCPPSGVNGSVNGKGKMPNVEILVLDSDDEDEGRVKRELSPSSATQSFEGTQPPASQSLSRSDADVIDLTLDDSDDEQEPVLPVKRKVVEAELDYPPLSDQAWKKTRIDPSSRILPPPPRPSINSIPPLHTPAVNNHSPTSPYPSSSFVGNTLPPPNINAYTHFNNANNGNRIGQSNSSIHHLPPLGSSFAPTQAQHARWRS